MTRNQILEHKPHPMTFVGVAKETKVTPEYVIQVVFDYYKVNSQYAFIRNNTPPVSHARQVAMYMLQECAKMTISEIGRYLNYYDHTSSRHGINTIRGLMDVDWDFMDEVEILKSEILSVNNTVKNYKHDRQRKNTACR